MASSVFLGKRLRRQIRTKVWPILEEAGFVEFAPLRAYRLGERTVEVVEFAAFAPEWREPRWIGGEAYANGATFTLHVGTYYRDVERLPWAAPQPRPRAHQCHRATRLAHESMDSAADGRTFYPGAKGERLEEVVEEAARVLRSRGLAYLDQYGDAEGWLDAHAQGGARHPGEPETVDLTGDEIAEMKRICREGRIARTSAMDGLHRRLHLADEHLTAPDPCDDVLAALLIGRGRIEDAMRCVEGPKREQLLKLAA